MKSLLLIFFIFFKTVTLNAESYYISEIFANALGNQRDLKVQWLELKNISHDKINIKALEVEILAGDSSLKLQRHLEPPMIFEDRLIIANQPDLGLEKCLNESLSIISFADFHIKRAKKIKLCVKINNEEPECANLGSQRFYDGVSLYREYDGMQLSSMWHNEPCLLGDGTFATPGLPERACAKDPNFAEYILSNCTRSSGNNNTTHELKKELGSKPLINAASFNAENAMHLIFKDDDMGDLWRVSLCAKPLRSAIICYELADSIFASANNENTIKMPLQATKGFKHSVLVRDLYGLKDSSELRSELLASPPKNNLAQIPLTIDPSPSHKFSLKLELLVDHVPINMQIIELNGQVLTQKAFVTPGIHYIAFTTKNPSILLTMVHLSESYNVELALEHKQHKSSCAAHDANFFFVMLIYAGMSLKSRFTRRK